MILYLGNCLARYLYYLHKKSDTSCRYKWCTNYNFLLNPPKYSNNLLDSIITSAPINYYLGFSENEQYEKIVITMPQYFVRNKYVKIDNRYLELNEVKNQKIKIEEVKYTWSNYADYFKEYTKIVQSKFPDTKIIIIFENPLPIEGYYGEYTYQFNDINKNNFEYCNDGFSIVEKLEVINKLLGKGCFFDSLYPWYTYDEVNDLYKIDNLHISSVYVNEIFKSLINSEEKQQLSLENNYNNNFLNKTEYNKIENNIDLLGMKINSSNNWKELEGTVRKSFKTFSKMMDHLESEYLNEKSLNENTSTLNIIGYQSVLVNICNKVKLFKECNPDILEELINRYLILINNLKKETPLWNYYNSNLLMLQKIKDYL